MAEAGESGGLPGRCSPPNRRIAELYRTLLAETKIRGRSIRDNFAHFFVADVDFDFWSSTTSDDRLDAYLAF